MKRQLINITVNFKKSQPDSTKCGMLAVGMFENDLKNSKMLSFLNKKLEGWLVKHIKAEDFKAKALTNTRIFTDGKIAAEKLLVIGLGDKEKFNADVLRKASSLAAKVAVDAKCPTLAMNLHDDVDFRKVDPEKAGQVLAEGAYFGAYRYDEFTETKKEDRPKKITISVLDSSASASKINKGIKTGSAIGNGQNISRTMANRPANVLFPMSLAAEARKIANKTQNLTCKVFNYAQLKQKKMGGIIAVGQGAENKPAMIIMKYTPPKAVKCNDAPIALVGKAITFDSGGISIKPGAGMDAMKYDMTGGASVLGAIKAIADMKLKVPVYAIICAAENKPGSGSYRPGDIITTFSGKTVEILNTDAEGRMVLSDGIHYAKTIKCKTIVDICTLTGACMVALGNHKAGLMSTSDEMIEKFKQASSDSGEPLWHLPCGDEYTDEMKSKIADLRNLGTTRWGGASTAASFLSEFAGDDVKWAHLDIAPTMEASVPLKKIATEGSIGFGVRVMSEFVRNMC